MGEYNRDVVEIGIKFARANITVLPPDKSCVTYVVEIRPARMKFARANMTVSAKNLASLL